MTLTYLTRCLVCDGVSQLTYRCNRCGADLAGETGQPCRADQLAEEDLVQVRFPVACIDCEHVQHLPIDYADVGLVLRVGCPECIETTKHRPVGQDRRYAARRLGFDVPDNPPSSTPV